MSDDDIVSEYDLNNICPEIDNELNGWLVDLIGDDFELGIFPEPSPDDENAVVVTAEIMAEDAELNSEQVAAIRKAVEERLAHNLGDQWEALKPNFGGVQVFFNDELQA